MGEHKVRPYAQHGAWLGEGWANTRPAPTRSMVPGWAKDGRTQGPPLRAAWCLV